MRLAAILCLCAFVWAAYQDLCALESLLEEQEDRDS